jgi:hypothetical protein
MAASMHTRVWQRGNGDEREKGEEVRVEEKSREE